MVLLASVALAAWVTRANYGNIGSISFSVTTALAPLLHRVRFQPGLSAAMGSSVPASGSALCPQIGSCLQKRFVPSAWR